MIPQLAAAGAGLLVLGRGVPRTLLISSSTHLVHLGPAALPSATQSPSRTASRGDIRVKLHQPT